MDNLDMIKLLIEYGYDYHINNDIAFIQSIEHTNYNIIKFFLESGIDIHKQNDRILDCVMESRSIKIFKLLIEYGADINNKENLLFQAIENEFCEAVQLLIDHGADINANYCNLSALETSMYYDDDIVKLLLENGAIIDHQKMQNIINNLTIKIIN